MFSSRYDGRKRPVAVHLLLSVCIIAWIFNPAAYSYSDSKVSVSQAKSVYKPKKTTGKLDFGDPLVNASVAGDKDKVIKLIKSGYSVNSPGIYDMTALIGAARMGRTEIAKILIDSGANVDTADISNTTALNAAVNAGHVDIADILLKAGANPDTLSAEQYSYVKEYTSSQNYAYSVPASMQKRRSMEIPTNSAKEANIGSGVKNFSNTKLLMVGGSVAAAGTAVGLAFGGGGGNDSSTVAYNPPAYTPPSGSAASFETGEYTIQTGLGKINASTAYSRGSAGGDILVAVVDTGVDVDHPDLAPNIYGGYDTVDEDFDPSPEMQGSYRSHGTHVAGIIAAVKNDGGMHGVAYQSKILPVRAGTSSGSMTEPDLAEGINYAVDHGAKVINNSWGSTTSIDDTSLSRSSIEASDPNLVAAYNNATSNKVVTVFAAGNSSASHPSVEAGLPVYFPEYENLWLAVVATDSTNTIASFSNKCGIAKSWCIAAPGKDIYSTYDTLDALDTGVDGYFYQTASGTSMAAPHVAGAVAVLMTEFPGLTAEQVVDILLSTATDLGDPGIDTTYGHGLVNLSAATAPSGVMMIPTSDNVNGGGTELEFSSIKLSSAFGDSLASTGLKVAALDAYNRSYQYELSSLIHTEDRTGLDFLTFMKFGQNNFQDNISVTSNSSVSFSQYREDEEEGKYGSEKQNKLQKATFTSKTDNIQIAANYDVPAQEAISFSSVSGRDSMMNMAKDTLANPYLGFAEQGQSVVTSVKGRNGTTYKTGSFYGKKENSESEVSGAITEISGKIGEKVTAGVQMGAMVEKGAFLGTETTGAFATNEEVPTYFTALSGEASITNNVKFHGSFSSGVSKPGVAADSLFSNVSSVVSQSLSIGASISKVTSERDRLGFAVSQPLRVISGKAGMNLPQSRDAAGKIFLQEAAVSLVPDGRETDFELSYLVDIGSYTNLKTGALYRVEPGNIESADPEGLFMVKLNHNF